MEKVQEEKNLHSLEKKVLRFIKANQMIESGDCIIVGVSGGADSVALAVILYRISTLLKISLQVVTVHHGIRGERANQDVELVEQLCNKLEISLYKEYVDVPTLAKTYGYSQEEAGRRARYECFERIAKQIEEEKKIFCRIAVAHHKEDNCETILHNLFRGSGLTGLHGILPVNNQMIRPLLETSRMEIEGYLKDLNIEYCIDETNFELVYTRNKIRNEVIPYLQKEINSKVQEHILQASAQIGEAEDFITDYVQKWVKLQIRSEEFPIEIPIDEFVKEKTFIQGYILRFLLRKNLKDITHVHITQAIQLVKKQVGASIDLPRDLRIRKGYTTLIIEKKYQQTETFCLPKVEYQTFSYDINKKIPETPCVKWFDYDKIKGTLSVRTRQVGDYMQIYPQGGTKTIKSMMIDKKIPKEVRDQVPLLVEDHHVLWMIGYRISEAYKVTEDTQTVLQVTIIKGGKS
jgi:tRNA(Ile)-lysidine synthase